MQFDSQTKTDLKEIKNATSISAEPIWIIDLGYRLI